MKKRILSLLLAFCLTLGLFAVAAPTIVRAEGGILDGSCGDNAHWQFDELTGKLTISGSGPIWDNDVWAGAPWYHLHELIKTVEIEDGITHIGSYVFFRCLNLTAVSIPESVTSIGHGVFQECGSLVRVDLPKGLTEIKASLFFECTALSSVTIPDGVTKIGQAAFWNCESLTELKLPQSVAELGVSAFSGCGSLRRIEIPAGITKISNGLFASCGSLTEVKLPDSVTTIGAGAFEESGLTSVSISANVTDITAGAFMRCGNLTGIWVDQNNPNYSSDATGALLSKDKTCLHQVPGGVSGEYRVPDSVKTIGVSALEGCARITGVIIPEGVETIGYTAFYLCDRLVSVEIPASVTKIVDMAFLDCPSLRRILVDGNNPNYSSDPRGALLNKDKTQLLVVPGGLPCAYTVPDTVTTIHDRAFFQCSELSSISLPEGLSTIEHWAFYNCANLERLVFPTNLTELGSEALYGCDRLTTLEFTGNCPKFYTDTFNGLTADAYYPGDNDTWEPIIMNNSGGQITWHPNSEKPAPHDHTFGSWEIAQDATTRTEGLEKRVCTCGEMETRPIPMLTNSFTDVKAGQFYYEPVAWASYRGITEGTGKNTFSPSLNCTRAQVVTFLWRANGCPEPKGEVNPFVDVKQSEYYYKAVLWAVENGITLGVDKTHFAPGATVTRGQFVTFLWRSEGKPAPSTESTVFTDLNPNQYYYTAVLWAAENGITEGMTKTTFKPGNPCTRGQVVTFLWRDLAE